MRFVLCDDDHLYTSMIEDMLRDHGHEVVGVAATTSDSVALVRAARPDVVIVELALGFNTDFDIVDAAISVNASTIVFSYTHDHSVLSQYPVQPTLVAKPDLGELERVVSLLERHLVGEVTSTERRVRPQRPATGRPSTNVGDAQAFYEAVNGAASGDVLVSVELAEPAAAVLELVADDLRLLIRDGDRLLASTTAVRIYLPAAGDVGAASFRDRLRSSGVLPDGAITRVAIIGSDESSATAFDRLKSTAPEPA